MAIPIQFPSAPATLARKEAFMTEKCEIEFEGALPDMARALRSGGVFLACEAEGKSNLMTISWGVLGLLWDRPIFGAFIQQSRYTFQLLEKAAHFTVNVPPPGLDKALALCGSASGRQTNKWTASGLTPMSAATVGSPLVAECVMHLECRVIHQVGLMPPPVVASDSADAYRDNEYHRAFWGEITRVAADPDAREKLARR